MDMLKVAEARRREESAKLNDTITKLGEAEARLKELEDKLPAVVTAAFIAAFRNPEVLQQIIDALVSPRLPKLKLQPYFLMVDSQARAQG